MNKYYSARLLLSSALLCSSSILFANEEAKPIKDDKTIAITALVNMSEYLRSLDKFSVQAHINTDDVLPSGQKIQLSKAVIVKSDPPSGLWAKSSSMHDEHEFFYDGKNFTIYSPQSHFYASFDAPDTVSKTVIKAGQEFNIQMPLSDLFYWGSSVESTDSIEEALIVGVDKVNGISCNHFAFRQQEIDWQICIQRGNTPLPLKLVIISKKEESHPQYTAVLKWDTAPVLNKQLFIFTPASTDNKINFSKADTK